MIFFITSGPGLKFTCQFSKHFSKSQLNTYSNSFVNFHKSKLKVSHCFIYFKGFQVNAGGLPVATCLLLAPVFLSLHLQCPLSASPPGRVAQSVARLARGPKYTRYPVRPHTFASPSAGYQLLAIVCARSTA